MRTQKSSNRNIFYRLVKVHVADEALALRGFLVNVLALGIFCMGALFSVSFLINFNALSLTETAAGVVFAGGAYWICKSGHITIAAFSLLIPSFLIVAYSDINLNSYQLAFGATTLFFALYVVAASALIGPRASFIFALLTTATLAIAYVNVPLQPGYQAAGSSFTTVAVPFTVTWLLALLSWQTSRAAVSMMKRLDAEKTALVYVNNALDERRETSANVSQQVRSLTFDLTSVASQQVSGAQEQAAALAQVQAAVRELTRTAERIAESAAQVELAARETDTAAQRVLSVTQIAAENSAQGQRAVSQTIAASEEVNNVYGALTRTLIDLAERSLRIKAILDLTQAIADETHLLSLNAAIEAAGAGQQGSRFSVVAQRVKELADRSRDSSAQIAQIVRELQARIQSAVMVAESGEKRARQSVGVAHESGGAITALAATVIQAAEEAALIVNTAQSVSDLARTIGQATREQQGASSQILATLTNVNVVAEATVNASQSISQSVSTLDTLSLDLNNVLTPA